MIKKIKDNVKPRFYALTLFLYVLSIIQFGLAIGIVTVAGAVVGVDLIATPTSGPAPLSVVLNWISAGVDACQRNNANVPVSGNEIIVGILADTSYSIVCTGGKDYTDISWTAPTQNIDGTSIPVTGAGSLSGFELYYSTSPTTVDSAIPVLIPKTESSYRITSQPNAVYYYKMRAVNVENNKSAYTVAVNNIIDEINVSSVAAVHITNLYTDQTTVYKVTPRNDAFVLTAVGDVPLNTNCNSSQTVNGRYVVPVSLVTWYGLTKAKATTVVAVCSTH